MAPRRELTTSVLRDLGVVVTLGHTGAICPPKWSSGMVTLLCQVQQETWHTVVLRRQNQEPGISTPTSRVDKVPCMSITVPQMQPVGPTDDTNQYGHLGGVHSPRSWVFCLP